jgi:polysaccharide deacetylase 2 family uncharacterized protein YibQ
MGARFLAGDAALGPSLGGPRERGSFFLDDGSSPASRAAGEAIRAPAVTAHLVLDRIRTREATDGGLGRLGRMAHEKGLAIGVASAFGTSAEAVAAWLPQAEKSGVVPASAAPAGRR